MQVHTWGCRLVANVAQACWWQHDMVHMLFEHGGALSRAIVASLQIITERFKGAQIELPSAGWASINRRLLAAMQCISTASWRQARCSCHALHPGSLWHLVACEVTPAPSITGSCTDNTSQHVPSALTKAATKSHLCR